MFNLPYAVRTFMTLLYLLSDGKITPYVEVYVSVEVRSTVFNLAFMGLLTSVVNPVVYIVRMGMVKRFFGGRQRQGCSGVREGGVSDGAGVSGRDKGEAAIRTVALTAELVSTKL